MKKVSKSRERSNSKDRVEAYKELVRGDFEFSTRLTLIQQLIPLGLMAIEEILQEEVTQLAGEAYSRGNSHAPSPWFGGKALSELQNDQLY